MQSGSHDSEETDGQSSDSGDPNRDVDERREGRSKRELAECTRRTRAARSIPAGQGRNAEARPDGAPTPEKIITGPRRARSNESRARIPQEISRHRHGGERRWRTETILNVPPGRAERPAKDDATGRSSRRLHQTS